MNRAVGKPGSPLRGMRLGWVMTALAAMLTLGGCAASTSSRPVSIDSRPTPPQPAPTAATGTTGPTDVTPAPAPHKPEPVTEASIAADTLQTHATLERCAKRNLLPDQESTVDAVRQALGGVRVELVRGDLPRAQSYARQAKQLARSLNCGS